MMQSNQQMMIAMMMMMTRGTADMMLFAGALVVTCETTKAVNTKRSDDRSE